MNLMKSILIKLKYKKKIIFMLNENANVKRQKRETRIKDI